MPEQILECEIHTLPENWYESELKEEFSSCYSGGATNRTELSPVAGYRRRGSPSSRRPIRVAEEDAPSRIEQLLSEIDEVVRESALAGSLPADEDTKRMAIKFAALLPTSIPIPEIASDPDGEISFDWLGPSDKIFSVSVDKNGRLAYAGRFGEKRKINGVEQLSEICPPEVLLGIERATS